MIASGLNIGRRRGEFEQATAAMRSVNAGSRDPESAGLCEMSRLADLYARVAATFASQCKEGRLAHGVPDEKWLQHNPRDASHPSGFTGRALDPEKLHVFFTETVDVTIRGGHVSTKREGETRCWCEPDLFAHLGSGYRVTIRFDELEPQLGAAIFNREVGSRNRDGFALGQFLGIAEYSPDAPQITSGIGMFSPDEEAAMSHKKRHDQRVRSEYRAIGVFGRKGRSTFEQRSSRSGVLKVNAGAGIQDGATVQSTGAMAEALKTVKTLREEATEEEVAALEKMHAEELGIYG
jgi:hypothetical protein